MRSCPSRRACEPRFHRGCSAWRFSPNSSGVGKPVGRVCSLFVVRHTFLCFPIHYREKCFYPRLGVRAFPSRTTITRHPAPSICRKEQTVFSLKSKSIGPENNMPTGTNATSAFHSVTFIIWVRRLILQCWV